jgi:hypothetical protein
VFSECGWVSLKEERVVHGETALKLGATKPRVFLKLRAFLAKRRFFLIEWG